MNLMGSFIKAAGVTAPPPAPLPQTTPTPLRQTAPTAPAPLPAVQQSEHATRAAATAARPIATQIAAGAPAAPEASDDAPSTLLPVPASPGETQRYERLEEARVAWIEGKPRNAPAVWPMFPSAENPGESAATRRAQTVWGMAGIMSAYAGAASGSQGAMIFDAVQAIRQGADEPRQVALGKA